MPVDPTKIKLALELKHDSPLFAGKFDPTGRYAFVSAQDNSIQRYDLQNQNAKVACNGHRTWVRSLAFAEGKLLSGDYSGQVMFWSVAAATPTPERTIDAHRGWVRSVVVSPNRRTFATCGNDRLVKLWSLPEGRLLRTFEGHDSHVYSLAFHPEGRFLVSGDLHGNVKQWDVESGRQTRTFDASVLFKFDGTFRADHGGARVMAISRDGAHLAVGGITELTNAFAGIGKPAVLLFRWSNGERVHLMKPTTAFTGSVWGMEFHPDGFLMAVGAGQGGAAWFWRLDNANSFHTQAIPNNTRDLSLHTDNKRFLVPCYDSTARIYEMEG